jgi:hypothetical protein
MEIPEIKRQLPIGRVLTHYGLKPDKHDRLPLPPGQDAQPADLPEDRYLVLLQQ